MTVIEIHAIRSLYGAPNNGQNQLHPVYDSGKQQTVSTEMGMPKTITWGGVKRASLSSQAQKRIAMNALPTYGLQEKGALRSRRIHIQITGNLISRGHSPKDAAAAATALIIDLIGSASTSLYIPTNCIDILTDNAETLLTSHPKLITDITSLLDDPKKVDTIKKLVKNAKIDKALHADLLENATNATIALSGRMVASTPMLSERGCLYIAPALGLEPFEPDVDFWTTTDDIDVPNEARVSNMGTRIRSGNTYYEYAAIDHDQLITLLNGDTTTARTAIAATIEALIRTTPEGQITSTGANNLPCTVLITSADHRIGNLNHAFYEAIDHTEPHKLDVATQQLLGLANRTISAYEPDNLAGAFFTLTDNDFSIEGLNRATTLREAIDTALTTITI